VTFSGLETKRSHTGPNLENMVDGVAEFDQFGLGEGGSVSRCVVMMEEHIFLRQVGPYFLQFGGESAQ